ncbi:MAG TPA: acyltransferase domain-containing protein, partial [Polyangiaceae bacterium]
MRYGQIPPSLNYETPNPQIDFPNTPFFVNARLRPWETTGIPRRAGVSSFGLGGTNVHLIVEEPATTTPSPGKGCEVLLLSAKTPTALATMCENLAGFLSQHSEANLADVAFTLQTGRQQFDYRRAVVARHCAEAVSELASKENRAEGTPLRKKPEVVFMFSGQGSQHVNMARDLYDEEPAFRSSVNEACAAFEPHLGLDLRKIIYPEPGCEAEASTRLNQTELAQPALFVIGYALANQLMEWGIEPSCLIGHSVGEYAAACISGVFSLEDAATVLSARARLMQTQPRGSMRAIRLPEAEVAALLIDGVSLAASNTPNLSVISGTDEAIAAIDALLASRGLATSVLHTSHAFHSAMMDPILSPFTEVVRQVTASPPSIPIFSTATADWLSDAEATQADYWVAQLRRPVRFSGAVNELLKSDHRIFIECGPNMVLTGAVRAHLPKDGARRAINCLPHVNDPAASRLVLHSAVGRYWTLGGTPEWARVQGAGRRQRVGLPHYPFERQRFWVDSAKVSSDSTPGPALTAPIRIASPQQVSEVSTPPVQQVTRSGNGHVESIVNQQLELMSRQLGLLMHARTLGRRNLPAVSPETGGNGSATLRAEPRPATGVTGVNVPSSAVEGNHTVAVAPSLAAPSNVSTFVGPQSRISKVSNLELTPTQRRYLDALIVRYNQRTKGSKSFAEKHRSHLADPRVVSGFKPITKELVYPIVVNRSLGSRLWDVDGNEYVDMLNGFGSNFFGHRAPFV